MSLGPTSAPVARFLNPGISHERLRHLLAELLALLPQVQEENEADAEIVFDELSERHSEEFCVAMRRAGHHVKLSG